MNGGIGMRIIDDNTISYSGCVFKKLDFDKIKANTTNAPADLRIGPGKNYKKLETLKKGTELFVLDETQEWVKVRVVWKEGYLHKNYLGTIKQNPNNDVPKQSTRKKKQASKTELKENTSAELADKQVEVSMDVKGWKWDRLPKPQLPANESGKVVFEIQINENGEVTRIITKEQSMSNLGKAVCEEEILYTKFSPIGKTVPSLFIGNVTFVAKSR